MSYSSSIHAQQNANIINSFLSYSPTCQITTMTIINGIGDLILGYMLYSNLYPTDENVNKENKTSIIMLLIIAILVVTVLTVAGIIYSIRSVKNSDYLNTAYYLQLVPCIIFIFIVTCIFSIASANGKTNNVFYFS